MKHASTGKGHWHGARLVAWLVAGELAVLTAAVALLSELASGLAAWGGFVLLLALGWLLPVLTLVRTAPAHSPERSDAARGPG